MKQFLLFLLPTIFSACSFAQDVATPKFMHVNVDGKLDDWGSLNFYDDQTQLNFGLANDSNNIYLCFQTMNQPAEMKILRAGMKITLSTKGKSKHETSIVFPLPPDKHESAEDSSHNENTNGNGHVFNKETFRQNFIEHHSTMQVSGFAHASGIVPLNDSDIDVAINWDTASNLIYEVAIAKKEFFGNNYSAKDANDEIILSVEVNGIPHAENGSNHAYHGGGFQGSGMRDGGGGMHGSGNGNFNHNQNNSDNSNDEQQSNSMNGNNSGFSLSSKASFKQRFVLNNASN